VEVMMWRGGLGGGGGGKKGGGRERKLVRSDTDIL